MADESLVCPSCGSTHPADERFCPQCGMPLVHADRTGVDEPVSAAHERARKIKPQFTEGDLVRVAGARHQAEAEFVQGMLLEEGIPSMLRRTRGFDVPDMLAAGPRDVMVPRSGYDAARDVLMQADIVTGDPGRSAIDRPGRILVGLVGALVVVGLIVWGLTQLGS
jgi:hypothetical protein